MFRTIDLHAHGFGQCCADGVGAALPFIPAGPGHQCHAFGFAEKVRVAQSVHQNAALVGQDDHAVAVPDLFEEVLHDRP
jgi:hypothetical protein